jgi:hypothetical protein
VVILSVTCGFLMADGSFDSPSPMVSTLLDSSSSPRDHIAYRLAKRATDSRS